MNIIPSLGGIETLTGSTGNDAFIFNNVSLLNRTRLVDNGGSDTFVITFGTNETSGTTSGEFLNTGSQLIFRTLDGREIVMGLDQNGQSQIEYLAWKNPISGRIQTLTIVTDLGHITGSNIAVVGTGADDTIVAPEHYTWQTGYSEIYANAGNDTITLSSSMLIFAYGGNGNDTINAVGDNDASARGDSGNDLLRGAGGSDNLQGNTGADLLYGNTGNDRLEGNGGSDRLYGGVGVDRLAGGAGNDTLVGGAGVDTFIFNRASGSDRIFFWQDGIDLIDLRAFGISGILELSAAISSATGSALIDLTQFGGDGSLTIVGAAGQMGGGDFIFA